MSQKLSSVWLWCAWLLLSLECDWFINVIERLDEIFCDTDIALSLASKWLWHTSYLLNLEYDWFIKIMERLDKIFYDIDIALSLTST